MIPFIIEIAKENLKSIENLEEVNILDEMSKITSNVISTTFFGKNFSELKVNGQLVSLSISDLMKDT